MSAVPYMKFYIGDYLGDTQHLTTLQHGAYLLLIMAYWQRRGPLPMDDDKLARIARCAIAEWMQCKCDVLAFFDECDGMLCHGRIDKELEGVAEVSEKRKSAAHKKWDSIPKSDASALQEDSKSNAKGMLSHIHSHIPYSYSDTEPKEENTADKPPRQTFIKPTIEEIKVYCQERGNAVDPCRFLDFYESKGWLIGKNKMKDWRAAVRTWEHGESKPSEATVKPVKAEILPICPVCGTTGLRARESKCPKCHFLLEPDLMADSEMVAVCKAEWEAKNA